ncbi:MAG: KH domain-containing protein [Patescibacteria group bacterium]
MEFDQQFVEFIVKALVNKPEEVRSDRKVDEQGVLITVHTSPEDTGYVIGKSGKTAVAIRTLLATIGAKANMRVSFRIDAPASSTRRAAMGDDTNAAAATTAALATDDDAQKDEDADSVDSLTF